MNCTAGLNSDNCPDCGVAPGKHHILDCDIEQCPECGTQLFTCSCPYEPTEADRLPWTGTWPGVKECQEYGWYSRRVSCGWESCGPDDFGDVTEDLNRLRKEAVWDRATKRYVRPDTNN
jgi:hypothetical protein